MRRKKDVMNYKHQDRIIFLLSRKRLVIALRPSRGVRAEGTHVNQTPQIVRGEGTHINHAFQREQKSATSTSLFLGITKCGFVK